MDKREGPRLKVGDVFMVDEGILIGLNPRTYRGVHTKRTYKVVEIATDKGKLGLWFWYKGQATSSEKYIEFGGGSNIHRSVVLAKKKPRGARKRRKK